jgi:hypothetical protein
MSTTAKMEPIKSVENQNFVFPAQRNGTSEQSSVTPAPPLSWLVRFWNWLLLSRQQTERLRRLIANYQMLPAQVRMGPANREAIEIMERVMAEAAQQKLDWSALGSFERALLTVVPDKELKAYGRRLRAEYRRVIGSPNVHLKSHQGPDCSEAVAQDQASLRSDLLVLQDDLHEVLAERRTHVRARNITAFWTIGLSVIAIFVTLQLDKILGIDDSIVFDVFGVGMFGGAFSTLQRIQKFKTGGSYEAAALNQLGNRLTIVLAPAIGGVGAIILYVMLAAGVLGGSLFPELSSRTFGNFSDALEDLFKLHIANSADAAKLYFFCFLAGFSERLVPDVLNRLEARAADASAIGPANEGH